MIIECPKCKKKYLVKEEQIPVGGGPVKCPNCNNIFTIYRKPLNIELIPYEIEPEKVEEETVYPDKTIEQPPVIEKPSETVFEKPTPTISPPIEKSEVSTPTPTIKEPETPTVAPPPTPTKTPSAMAEKLAAAFGIKSDEFPADWDEEKKKKHRDAKRLARSLAKDILLYHKQEVEEGLRNGNIAQLLGEEIRKSWEFYKQKIDPEVQESSSYFKNALNEILGQGKKIFV